ncbi:unnamed protein product [Lymnaea stagnalis]|uniref:Uncharacterized protein n=1 Tax=Lymnaea stagnalis TaxID=6523 RepID=A0AAV2H8E9_LYMST
MTTTDESDFNYCNAKFKSRTLETLKHMLESPKDEVEKQLAQSIFAFLPVLGVSYVDEKWPSFTELASNPAFKEFLFAILSLGRGAKSDHQLFKKTAKPNKNLVLGLTGKPVHQTDQESMAIPKLKKDNSDQEFIKLKQYCEEEIKELDDNLNEISMRWNTSDGDLGIQNCKTNESELNLRVNELKLLVEERLNKLSGGIQEMMSKWRRLEAILHIKHDLSNEAIHTAHTQMQHLQDVFKQAYNLTRKDLWCYKPFRQKLEALKLIIKNNAWCYEKQPPKCLEVAKGKRGEFVLTIRIFGISEDQLDRNFTWNYILEKGCDDKIIRKEVKVIGETSVQSTECGILISVNMRLEDYKRTTKRTSEDSFDHFNRIVCQIKFKMTDSLKVECWSLPFTVRTGNSQLWPYTGAVDWYCWAREDLYKAPYRCPKDMNMDNGLSMLQAKYEAIDPEGFTPDHIKTLQTMIQSFTTGRCIKMHDFIQKSMPYQNHGKLKNPTDHKISFYTWFVAVCNTAKKFKKCLVTKSHDEENFRFIASFLSYEACLSTLKRQPIGSTILRLSQNRVISTQSSMPCASIIVHVVSYPDDYKDPVSHHVCNCDNEEDLIRELSGLALPDKNPLVKTIVYPRDISFTEIKKCFPDKETINVNGYCTRTSEKKTIVLHKPTTSRSTYETPAAESTSTDDETQPSPSKIPRHPILSSQSKEFVAETDTVTTKTDFLPQDLKSLKRSELFPPISPSNAIEIYGLLAHPFDKELDDISSE